jgi:DNA-binding response OmpR family regulator
VAIAMPCISPSFTSISVLAISPAPDDHSALRTILARSRWTLRVADNLKAAFILLARDPVPVVICKRELPDGDWRTLLRKAEILPRPPRVLVSARYPSDQLWDEVGNAGGYDVLTLPFEAREVFCAVRLGWESWHRQWEPAHRRTTA